MSWFSGKFIIYDPTEGLFGVHVLDSTHSSFCKCLRQSIWAFRRRRLSRRRRGSLRRPAAGHWRLGVKQARAAIKSASCCFVGREWSTVWIRSRAVDPFWNLLSARPLALYPSHWPRARPWASASLRRNRIVTGKSMAIGWGHWRFAPGVLNGFDLPTSCGWTALRLQSSLMFSLRQG